MTDEPRPLQVLPPMIGFLDDLPMSVILYASDGTIVAMNRVAEQLWGAEREKIIGTFNILTDPQSVSQGSPALFARARAGERVETHPVKFDTSQVAVERTEDRVFWIQATLFPVHSGDGAVSHVGIIHRDVTEQVEHLQEIENARSEIANQREAITTLSSPVVEVWEGILTVPLVGILDARRASVVTENLLNAIVSHSADVVILDVTGVPVVDTSVANYLLIAARSAMLLGSQVALVGLKSEIAQTLVHIGVDLSYLVTRANLKAGIAWAFERQGLRVVNTAPAPKMASVSALANF